MKPPCCAVPLRKTPMLVFELPVWHAITHQIGRILLAGSCQHFTHIGANFIATLYYTTLHRTSPPASVCCCDAGQTDDWYHSSTTPTCNQMTISAQNWAHGLKHLIWGHKFQFKHCMGNSVHFFWLSSTWVNTGKLSCRKCAWTDFFNHTTISCWPSESQAMSWNAGDLLVRYF